jgi:hypothetical protein
MVEEDLEDAESRDIKVEEHAIGGDGVLPADPQSLDNRGPILRAMHSSWEPRDPGPGSLCRTADHEKVVAACDQ